MLSGHCPTRDLRSMLPKDSGPTKQRSINAKGRPTIANYCRTGRPESKTTAPAPYQISALALTFFIHFCLLNILSLQIPQIAGSLVKYITHRHFKNIHLIIINISRFVEVSKIKSNTPDTLCPMD